MSPTGSVLTPRAFRDQDIPAVLTLINADQLPGQPSCTREMLADALAGRSSVDAGWWMELDSVTVDVLCDADGGVQGVVSFARRARDQAGLILWLHGREHPAVIAHLADHALDRLTGVVRVEAFEFATALAAGLEGLPARHRPVTRQVLRERGFVEADLWRYMHRALPAPELPVAPTVTVEEDPNRPGWLLEIRGSDGALWGDAQVSIPIRNLGVLWWIGVEPTRRGQGLGRGLLGAALDVLHRHGAHEAILYVDDDAPADDPERGRGAANSLYDRSGFVEVDRLCSYQRS
jgi:GNAT superfamily N-acetyltransferase